MKKSPLLWYGTVWLLLAAPVGGAEPIRIVADGRPHAVVFVAPDADAQTRQAAELLVRYVRQSSGAELPTVNVLPDGSAEEPVIQVGTDTDGCRQRLKLDELDGDGFAIRVDDGRMVIAGPTAYGTEFGVYEFLERYVGVRWLMPGPDGTDVPQLATIDVPAGEIREQPAIFSRQFSGLQGQAQVTWARRNRMHGRVEFHHNLQRLFAPETYVSTHPEFFPIRQGKRYFPPDNNTHGWQPCFSADGITEEAIKNIDRYFTEHPDATSYSLGVVDSSGHCECEKCQAKDTGELNFLGRRNVSDRYYDWCNRVVEGVLEKHPGKFFGCLAYSEVAQPPSRVKVHPNIIPFMTYDRMKWSHQELRAEGRAMTERWERMSPLLGWYDYIYGAAYCLPRVWFHQMADYYRFGHAHRVRAMYAEAYPNWGEGPKLYVSLKLQWNPDRDVDELLQDWYVRAVGPEAADDLAAYYAIWEDFWTRRILDSPWFTTGGQYLRFNDPSYLQDVPDEDIATSRMLLERVVSKAETREQKARAGILMKAFEYYEASAIAYRGGSLARQAAVRSETDALRMLDQAQRLQEMATKRRQLLMHEFARIPGLEHGITFDRYPKLRGEDWAAAPLWSVFDQAAQSKAVRDRLQELAGSTNTNIRFPARAMLTLLDQSQSPISRNPSFEQTDGQWPAEWSRWIKFGTGTKSADPAAAHSGEQGVLCRGMKRGGPHQTVDITPGCYAAMAYVRVPRSVAGEATISLQMTPLDEQGQNLPAPGLTTTVPAVAGDWTRLAVAGEIPATIDNKPVKRVRLIVIVDGFQPDEEVYIDDVAMCRIE